MESQAAFEAPPGHPPLLSADEVGRLLRDGHLSLSLPTHLADQYSELFAQAARFFTLPEATKTDLYPSRPNDTEQGYSTCRRARRSSLP